MRHVVLGVAVVLLGACPRAPHATPDAGRAVAAAGAPADAGPTTAGPDAGVAPAPAKRTWPLDMTCWVFDKWVLGAMPRADNGYDFTVWDRATAGPARCGAPAEAAVFTTREASTRFVRLEGDVLFLERGTGPDAQEYEAFQLPDGGSQWKDDCTSASLERGRITCRRARGAATPEDCPQYQRFVEQQLNPTLVETVTVDVDGWEETVGEHLECEPFQ